MAKIKYLLRDGIDLKSPEASANALPPLQCSFMTKSAFSVCLYTSGPDGPHTHIHQGDVLREFPVLTSKRVSSTSLSLLALLSLGSLC